MLNLSYWLAEIIIHSISIQYQILLLFVLALHFEYSQFMEFVQQMCAIEYEQECIQGIMVLCTIIKHKCLLRNILYVLGIKQTFFFKLLIMINKQRKIFFKHHILIIPTRNIDSVHRHFMQDILNILPHSKKVSN